MEEIGQRQFSESVHILLGLPGMIMDDGMNGREEKTIVSEKAWNNLSQLNWKYHIYMWTLYYPPTFSKPRNIYLYKTIRYSPFSIEQALRYKVISI